MTNEQKTPFAISAKELAGRMEVSLRHVRRMDSSGQLPRPIKLGKCVRWSVEEINNWIDAGTPNREEWEMRKVAS